MSDLIEIASNFSSYLVSVSPQIREGSLQWYIAGSLATNTMVSAENMTELKLDDENNVIGETQPKVITEHQRAKISKVIRKLGIDIDIVNVKGNMFRGAQAGNKPSIGRIKQNVPNIMELMSWSPTLEGTGYIDNLDYERSIVHHQVARIKTQNGCILVTAPPEQLAHKLAETISLSQTIASGQAVEDQIQHYQKDIKDLTSMFYGFKDLYEKEEFLHRVYTALNEKDGALFSIHNSIYNNKNAREGQAILDKYIMQRVIQDSSSYFETIDSGESKYGIQTFLNDLMARRALDVEKMLRNEPTNIMTTLQQREQELSALEAEAKNISEAEALIDKQNEKNGQDIGE